MTQLTLYGNLLCPYLQRVRFTLQALKVDYAYVEVDLFTDEQKTESYKKINPFGKTPTLVVNNISLFESLPILEYLENEFSSVFPKDNIAKAQQRIWVTYFDQNVGSKFFGLIHQLKEKNQEGAKAVVKELLENLRFFVKHSGLEKKIKQNPQSYFEGNTLTYLDFAIIPHSRILNTLLKSFVGQSIFEFAGSEDELIGIFEKYFHNITSSDEYQSITDKIKNLPKNNTLLKVLYIETPEQFDFDTAIKEQFARKVFA